MHPISGRRPPDVRDGGRVEEPRRRALSAQDAAQGDIHI